MIHSIMTLSIMIFCITAHGIKTLRILSLAIMTHCITMTLNITKLKI
jgi:hypothetical protein